MNLDNAKLAFDLAIAMPGGGIVAVLLWPMGCSTDTLVEKDVLCLEGERTNLFGSTMGGLVGDANSTGAFFLGLVVAAVIFGGLVLYQATQNERQ